MAKVGQADLLARYRKVNFDTLQFLTSPEKLKNLFTEASIEPENSKQAEFDSNDIFVSPLVAKKKKVAPTQVKIGVEHQ